MSKLKPPSVRDSGFSRWLLNEYLPQSRERPKKKNIFSHGLYWDVSFLYFFAPFPSWDIHHESHFVPLGPFRADVSRGCQSKQYEWLEFQLRSAVSWDKETRNLSQTQLLEKKNWDREG
jgi:hypothetical protein